MKQNRRNFMKGTGAVCASALTSRLPTALASAAFGATERRGMARGLTLLNIRRGTECRLGVKDEKEILDVVEAAKILHMHAPATIDDLLQNQDGPSLNALVDAAAKSKAVDEADALSYVAGYATGNDFTARDLQLETGGQWMVGKTPDQFGPTGPYLVTGDQINPDNLKLECRVNGETRQSSNTSDFIFDTRKMISYISRVITLKPGDIVFTGTPQGVIQGKPKDQQVWLKPGDKIACSVERLGELKFELV
jgi:hypothetical protein